MWEGEKTQEKKRKKKEGEKNEIRKRKINREQINPGTLCRVAARRCDAALDVIVRMCF